VVDPTNSREEVYIDGRSRALSAFNEAISFSGIGTNTFIGQHGNGADFHFQGSIDEVRVYNRALTQSEITALYGRGTGSSGAIQMNTSTSDLQRGSSLASGLVGHWTMDGADTQATITDRSGQSNNGYFVGGATSSAKAQGKLGQALNFDGTDDYVNVGDLALVDGATSASVCVWMNYTPSSVTVDGAIVSEFNSSGWMLFVDDVGSITGRTNTIDFLVDNSGGASGRIEGSTNLVTPGTWDHYCGVFVGGTSLTLYKNGVQDLQNTTTIVSAVNSSSNALRIAGSAEGSPGRPLNAKLDDVRVYNRALSTDEVKALYRLGGTTLGI
jgi:hypothetical protein